jgi:hypothetical protein
MDLYRIDSRVIASRLAIPRAESNHLLHYTTIAGERDHLASLIRKKVSAESAGELQTGPRSPPNRTTTRRPKATPGRAWEGHILIFFQWLGGNARRRDQAGNDASRRGGRRRHFR